MIATDSGYTRADTAGNKFCCLFFARGCCPLGSECTYLHRLPLPASELPDASLDCFGRQKHATYRDDMGGVGSFQKENRTLYVGRIKANTRNLEQLVEEQFSEWGEIERSASTHADVRADCAQYDALASAGPSSSPSSASTRRSSPRRR